MRPAQLRRRFLLAFWYEVRVVWPILSGVVVIQLVLGILVGYLEGWRMGEAAYFTFVTGLTIGYGDLVPVRLLARVIAVVIGLMRNSVDRADRGDRCPGSPGSY